MNTIGHSHIIHTAHEWQNYRGCATTDSRFKNIAERAHKAQSTTDSKRREWTDLEDVLLKSAVGKYGTKDWVSVAQMVQSRNRNQCCCRWWRHIRPEITFGQWSKKEDALLKQAVKAHGYGCWALVSRVLEEQGVHRTDMQCRSHWELINKNAEISKKRQVIEGEEDFRWEAFTSKNTIRKAVLA